MPVTITNPVLAEHAAEIRRLGKQTVENVIEIGRHLAEAKAEVKKLGGAFDDWLKAEFNWSHGQAYNFINVFERKSELSKFTSRICLSPRFYLLAAPSTPPEARAEIIERAEAGESVPVAEVKRVVERHRQPAKRSNRPKVPDPPPPSDEVLQQRAATAERIRALRGIAKPAIPEIPDRNDIGPDSASEAGRLRARNEELERENRRLMGENCALRAEVRELRAAGGKMSITEFQAAIKKWEDTVENQRGIIATLQRELDELRTHLAPGDPGPLPAFLDRRAMS